MCGIVGVFNTERKPVSESLLVRMNEQIVHRGPDDDGYWLDGHVGLAMRRLSIIDVAGGKQPLYNEDGQIVTVYNGEIYNFPELRKGLIKRGHTLRTKCDTEVIPHLYEEKGDTFINDLNGMFAIGLWDRTQQRLLLIRDRLGIKPLYYTQANGQVLFGSELKSLVAAGIDRTVSKEALYHYLTYGYIPAPLTIYHNVFKLQPGHLAIVTDASLEIKRYWEVKPGQQEVYTEEEWLEQLEELLMDAVRRRLISDVPLGALLSGGVDSSLVVAMMAKCSRNRVKTFTIGFDEAYYNEAQHARKVAEQYGTDHNELIVRPKVADHFEKIVLQYDEPFADSSAIPTYFVSKMAREHVTVALSGDGGDELFAGYNRYVEFFRKRPLYYIPSPIRRYTFGSLGRMLPFGTHGKRFLLSLALNPLTDFVTGRGSFSNNDLISPDYISENNNIDTMDIAKPYINAHYPHELDALCMHDLKLYLPDDILTKVDRASMAVSLEVRVPLLDYRLVEFAFGLPPRLRLRGNTGKYLLKRLLERYLPAKHIYRSKHGFGVPLSKWFRNELREPLHDMLNTNMIRNIGLFNPKTVQRIIDMHMTGKWNYASKIWQVLVAQIWGQRFLTNSQVISHKQV
ncbi:MAG: asparagine synthase (glutamine-hydrolyzing) [Sedimentisphaerales bacterium]|nr:asparagine synthase (glutamine-hydrolyzing) [Sedimentisphaerales bacterium]